MWKPTVVLCLFCLSVLSLPAAAETNNPGGSAYRQLLSAQHQVLQSELTQHQTRLNGLEKLLAGGHASWLEVRRQRLKTQTIEVQIDLHKQLAALVEQAQQSSSDESIFDGMLDSPGKLLFTDLQLKTESPDHDIEYSMLQQLMSKTEQEILPATKPTSAHMELVAAHQALATEFQNWMQQHSDTLGSEADHGSNQVSEELLAASRKQCQVHDQLIALALTRERERMVKVNELLARNMTNAKDVQILQGRIDQLLLMQQEQKQVMDYLMQQEPSPVAQLAAIDERSLTQEIRFQFEHHEAQFQKASSDLEKEFLKEVLSRLEIAAASTFNQQNSRLGNALAIGQQNEMNGYRHRIRMMELESEFAQCRLDVLNAQAKSGTFLAVSLADEPERSPNLVVGFSPVSLVNVLVAPGNKSKALPSALLDSAFDPFPFQFQSRDDRFLSVSLTRRSPAFFSSSVKPRSSKRSPITFPGYPSRLSSSRYSTSTSRYGSRGSSSYRSSPTLGQAYRFGAIRSDLRPFLRVGQVPWYFPGSPTNLGRQQLRTSQRFNSYGVSGRSLLDSTSFTDLHGR